MGLSKMLRSASSRTWLGYYKCEQCAIKICIDHIARLNANPWVFCTLLQQTIAHEIGKASGPAALKHRRGSHERLWQTPLRGSGFWEWNSNAACPHDPRPQYRQTEPSRG